jgi:hypothetical protein
VLFLRPLRVPEIRGSSPVCEPTPAVPRPMPGLSNSASAGSIGGRSGRAALARVGLAGSFFGFVGRDGGFAIAANMATAMQHGKSGEETNDHSEGLRSRRLRGRAGLPAYSR